MATVIHAREVSLQNTSPRVLISEVTVTASAGSFNKPANSTVLVPNSITLTATHTFTAPTFTWHYALSNTPTTWVAFGTNNAVQTITKETFAAYIGTSSYVTYRCTVTQSEYVDAVGTTNILYSVAAAESVSFVLSNEAQVVPATVDGVVTDFTGAESALTVYLGVVDDTVNWSFTASWVNIAGTIVDEVVTVLSWSGTSSADLNFTEVLENTPAGFAELVLRPFPSDTDIGYVDIIAFRTGYQSQLKRFVVTKVRQGDSGVGQDGDKGDTGDSHILAYAKVTGASLSPTPTSITTTGYSSNPPTNTWGGSEVWSRLVPSFTAGESVFQTDGLYNVLTDLITWGAPYLSSLKVGALSAITANLGTITAGTITLDSSGFIRGGQTAWNTGTGFWLGYTGGAYKFSIGSSTVGMTWDGSALNIAGGNITIGTTGNIKGGMTSYAVGSGFFLGYEGGQYKFSVGSGDSMLKWDGTTLYVPASNITGQITTQQIATGSITSPFVNTTINFGLSITNPLYPPYNVGSIGDQSVTVSSGSPLAPLNSTSTISFSGYLNIYLPVGGFGGGIYLLRYRVGIWVVSDGADVLIAYVDSKTRMRIDGQDTFFLPVNLVGSHKVSSGTMTSCYLRVEFVEFRQPVYAGNSLYATIQSGSLYGHATMVTILL